MASAEREPITGVWGRSPQRGPGAEPLVRGSGGQSPPEAERVLALEWPKERSLFSQHWSAQWRVFNTLSTPESLNKCIFIA
jgi:hypothetical protein